MSTLDLTMRHKAVIFVIGTHASLHTFVDELLELPRPWSSIYDDQEVLLPSEHFRVGALLVRCRRHPHLSAL